MKNYRVPNKKVIGWGDVERGAQPKRNKEIKWYNQQLKNHKNFDTRKMRKKKIG